MRVFLDANILFSGGQEDSPIQRLLERLAAKSTLVTSPYAVNEAERNIAIKRPAWMPGLQKLLRRVEMESALADFGHVTLDPGDRPILGAAIAAHCSHFLTGDMQHFDHLMNKSVKGVKIVSARILHIL